MESATPLFNVVDAITISVSTGDTLYPGESGFASLMAQIESCDSGLVQRLEEASSAGRSVGFRCAMIDVIGKVTRQDAAGSKYTFTVVIDDLRYRRPGDRGNGA